MEGYYVKIKNRKLRQGISIILAIGMSMGLIQAEVPAFPGAEGYGAKATGGRGGNVIKVTNLNDSGTGSLRAAIEASGTRTVIFEVSGIIALNSNLEIKNDNITIAGQTAPGDGICIRNYPLRVNANNVIIRYIRSRLGDEKDIEDDAMSGRNRSNIIIDHCSMSWSVDECASFYDNKNFTMQWCILSESLYKSVHDKGNHGYAGIWGGKGATFHHNLLAHHSSRNPRFCGSRYSKLPEEEKIDHRNNVIFNWGANSCYGAEGGSYNIVNNYYKYGPATSITKRDRIIGPNAQDPDASNQQPGGVWGTFYVDGNYVYGIPATTENNWIGVDPDLGNGLLPGGSIDGIKSLTEFSAPNIVTVSAEEAFEQVLAYAGAIFPKRDPVDERIVMETRTGKPNFGASYGSGKGIIDTPSDVGGYPTYHSTTAPVDSDNDGMPDAWEDANGLNKSDPNDGKAIASNGYTNLENYLNSLVELPEVLFRPIAFNADTMNGMEVHIKWQDISDNEDGFIIERSAGSGFSELASVNANITSYIDNEVPDYGRYYYRIKAFNAEMESYYTDSVKVDVDKPVSVHSANPMDIKLMFGPNPFSKSSWLRFHLDQTKSVEIAIFDITGKVVKQIESNELVSGNHHYQIDADGMTSGIYFLHIDTKENNYMLRLMIQR
jgi:hypothetical protein